MTRNKGLILRNENAWEIMARHLAGTNYSSIFILVDENTEKLCLPVFYAKSKLDGQCRILKIESGERNKNIASSTRLWEQLSTKGADRNSLLINLGGGMITDLGGFVASTFKRGIDFINIPTTLLGMVDASIGGKNGIDFGPAKNQIGTVNTPEMVIVENAFLKSLPQRQLTSGMAEMIKHSLISSRHSWERIQKVNSKNILDHEDLIWESIEIKEGIVVLDPFETGLRKTLNYGHTLGHAIESHSLENPAQNGLLHGEAIAIGMVLATYISNKLLGFPEEELLKVSFFIKSLYPTIRFTEKEIHNIIDLLIYDKKNREGKVLFVL